MLIKQHILFIGDLQTFLVSIELIAPPFTPYLQGMKCYMSQSSLVQLASKIDDYAINKKLQLQNQFLEYVFPQLTPSSIKCQSKNTYDCATLCMMDHITHLHERGRQLISLINHFDTHLDDYYGLPRKLFKSQWNLIPVHLDTPSNSLSHQVKIFTRELIKIKHRISNEMPTHETNSKGQTNNHISPLTR